MTGQDYHVPTPSPRSVPAAAPSSPAPLPSERGAAEQEYLDLVRDRLPRAAREGRWVLRLDHCFGRVLLDAAVGGCWYDALDRRRPAYRQLSDPQLATALELGRRLLAEGDPLLRELDAQSLRWRGKPPKRPRAG